jgi:hypothetical protein
MKSFLCIFLLTTSMWADDSAALIDLLAKGGVVTIPAGEYHLDGIKPLL